MNINIKTSLIIVLFVGLYLVYNNINVRYIIPKKKVNFYQPTKVLLGLPTIDRDHVIVEHFYKLLSESISQVKDIQIDLLVTMRYKDEKMYKFWKDKAKIKLFEDYFIEERHNLKMVSETFNYIKNYSYENNYDTLIFVESDIFVQKDTIQVLLEKIKHSHVVLFPFETPWAKYPIVLEDGLFYNFENARNYRKDKCILGHGTGCMAINKQVMSDKNVKFDHIGFKGIFGQDVGFFQNLNRNYYKVLMINNELYHAYNEVDFINNLLYK